MTDVIIQANRESPLSNALSSQLKSNLSYSISKNYPNLATHLIEVSPNIAPSGDPASAELIFTIPKYGIARSMTIESTLTTAGNNAATADNLSLGERVFSSVEWRSHNKSIVSQNPVSCKVRGQNEKFEMAMTHHDLVNSATSFNATSVTVHTPFYTSFFEDVKNNMDLTFVEQTQVICRVNTQAGMGLAAALTAGTFKLWFEYYSLESAAHEDLTARNYKPSSPLTYLSYDVATEVQAVTASATSTVMELRNNNLISSIDFMVRDTATQQLNPVSDYTLQVSGNVIRQSIPAKIAQLMGARRGYGQKALQTAQTTGAVTNALTLKPLSVYFGLEGDRKYNSGSASFNNLNNPRLTVTHGSGSTDEMVANFNYWTLVSVSPSNGVIERGLST